MLLAFSASAQFEIGFKAGMNTTDLNSNSILFENGETDLELAFKEAQYGLHFGLYTRIKVAAVYIEPSFLLNSSSVSYEVTEFEFDDFTTQLRSEQFTNLDIPLLIGMKFGFFRIALGPVAHINLDSTSELFNIQGYEQNFKDATYGFQAGAGLDIWKLRFDINIEGNLSKFGDHITIDGQDLSFDQSASRVLFSVGYKF